MEYKPLTARCTCLQCGGLIFDGRYDRKYCSDKCRNKYHNSQRSRMRGIRLKVLNSLEKNYDILDRLLRMGCRSMGKLELADMGFKCSVVTSFCKKARALECRCFDIRYNDRSGKITDISRVLNPPDYFEESPD